MQTFSRAKATHAKHKNSGIRNNALIHECELTPMHNNSSRVSIKKKLKFFFTFNCQKYIFKEITSHSFFGFLEHNSKKLFQF